jgi:hypothetical protein
MAATKISETTLHIGGNTATLSAEATWVEVVGFRSWSGNLGGQWQVTDTSVMKDVVSKSMKTTYSAGEITVVVVDDPDDAGLTALDAAEVYDGASPYNFKLTNASGDILRFKAHVRAAPLGAGNRQNIYERSVILALQTRVERVAA